MINRECPFKDNPLNTCPIPEELVAIGGHCDPNAYGQTCGPLATYEMLLQQQRSLELADMIYPIVGTYTSGVDLRSNLLPEDIRHQIAEVSFPIRKPDYLPQGQVHVSAIDAVLSLMKAARLDATEYLFLKNLDYEAFGETFWVFTDPAPNIQMHSMVSSHDYYSAGLDNDVMTQIETFLESKS